MVFGVFDDSLLLAGLDLSEAVAYKCPPIRGVVKTGYRYTAYQYSLGGLLSKFLLMGLWYSEGKPCVQKIKYKPGC